MIFPSGISEKPFAWVQSSRVPATNADASPGGEAKTEHVSI
jgi:hypothetical protein